MKTKTLADITLTLFFTGGISLKTWSDVGNLNRELELYNQLAQDLKAVNIVSYGEKRDREYAKHLGAINLLSTTWHNSPTRTILHLLSKHLAQIYGSDILKTNQIPGSEIPIWLKKHMGKKLIVRCGYLHSYFIKKQSRDQKTINDAIRLEKNAFSYADMGIVTTSWQRELVIKLYAIDPAKITVIPNYVVTDAFKPDPETKKEYDLIFVGRAGRQKNLGNLLKAIHYLKTKNRVLSLLMVGGCCNDTDIKELVNQYALNVTFKGNIPNFNLPHIINQAKAFILPSYYEGHPKVLLEAMSCGIPCIGSDVTGIREDIDHMKTGYLCETDYKSIATAIDTVLSDDSLQRTMGKNAREHILKKYSIDKIVKLELEVIQAVIAK
ncbi:MAG: glycosyltransferase family 4 protein [Methanophagales archaeon]|nr:glycosyltransferase family 4 protein [Methanophagales archaeon]